MGGCAWGGRREECGHQHLDELLPVCDGSELRQAAVDPLQELHQQLYRLVGQAGGSVLGGGGLCAGKDCWLGSSLE